MKSTTKSMGGLALLLALDEGKLALSDKANAKIPAVFGTDPAVDTSAVTAGGLADITVLQLATHTAGFSKSDQTALKLLYAPGTTWWYSDQGLDWLADVLTQTYAQDLNTLLSARIYTTLGVRPNLDLNWRNNKYRTDTLDVNGTAIKRRELASGINANVNAMARVGQLMLRKGVWGTQRLLSEDVVAKVHTPPAEIATAALPDATNFPGATTNYGILWWTNATGQIAGVPTDAYWAWGLHETFIIVVPSKDLVIARAGDHAWHPTNSETWNGDYQKLAPFITPIVQAAE
jgi:CubicO group peptidase (beta-lactamase class C family)